MNKIIKKNREVEYISTDVSLIDSKWIKRIKKESLKNKSKKYRTCIHNSEDSKVHEMLIAHNRDTYVRPHKHSISGESIHIIEGECILLLFDTKGNITKYYKLGEALSGLPFYLSIKKSVFHSIIIKSKFLIFKETKSGPFRKSSTIFPMSLIASPPSKLPAAFPNVAKKLITYTP